MPKTPAWQRKEGKNPKGGLNAKVVLVIIKVVLRQVRKEI